MEYVRCVCVFLEAAWVERGVWMRGLGLGFTNYVGTGGVFGRVSVFRLRWCRWCRWGLGRELGPGSGRVGLCYVCVSCESGFFCVYGRSMYLRIVLGGYLRILGAPSVQSCCTLWISAS